MIRLDASPQSDLQWDLPPEENRWHLDFGWTRSPLDPRSPLQFNAALLALETLASRLEGEHEVILLVSNGEFSSLFQEEEDTERSQLDFANLLSEYLHRLAAILPERMTPTLLFEIDENQNFAELALLLCRRRFEHFQLKFSKVQIPVEGEATVGVVLPQDEEYDPKRFAPLFQELSNEPFLCIPEELLNEHWDGLDSVIVDPEHLSETGERMLCGFEAAGGAIKRGWTLLPTPLSE